MTKKQKDVADAASGGRADDTRLVRRTAVDQHDVRVPQSTFPKHLVRNQSASTATSQWLERLCAAVEADAMPIVREALVHETAAQSAGDWLTVAKASLAHLLEVPEIDRAATARLEHSLQNAIANGLPSPPDEEVRQHTGELVATMVTSWLEALRKLTRAHRILMLDEYLLPPRSLDEQLFTQLMRALDPYAVGRGDGAGTIMKSLARKLFETEVEVNVPYGIRLRVTSRANDRTPKVVEASVAA